MGKSNFLLRMCTLYPEFLTFILRVKFFVLEFLINFINSLKNKFYFFLFNSSFNSLVKYSNGVLF